MSRLNGILAEIVKVLPDSNYNDYVIQYSYEGEIVTIKVRDEELQEIKDDRILQLELGQEVIYTPLDITVKIDQINYLYGQVAIRFPDDGVQVVGLETLRLLDEESVALNKDNDLCIQKFKVGDKVKTKTDDDYNNLTGTIMNLKSYNYGTEYTVMFEDGRDTVFNNKELEFVAEKSKSGRFTEIALELGQFTDEKNKQYGSSVDATYEMIKVLMERYTYDEENYLMPKSLLQHILLQVRMMDKQNRLFNNPSGKGDSESPYKDLVGYSLIGVDMVERNNEKTN
ncbi:hypothetical protein E0Y62_26720 [Cytobacillus praedii]|uniref:Uncharacterized protein n=1 Tax=Cytobacillus praedii TaxID=1742358 RepID=A0A4R1AT48_9BACI|nr:hypothetical protein E0Y62_26720 [Cytobacillus praedii]